MVRFTGRRDSRRTTVAIGGSSDISNRNGCTTVAISSDGGSKKSVRIELNVRIECSSFTMNRSGAIAIRPGRKEHTGIHLVLVRWMEIG